VVGRQPISKQAGPPRSTRDRKPNEFVMGPDWRKGYKKEGMRPVLPRFPVLLSLILVGGEGC
jgi:hypothetical protein